MEQSNVVKMAPTQSPLDVRDEVDRKLSQALGIVGLAAAFEEYEQETRKGDLRGALEAAQTLVKEAREALRGVGG
jgi:hypothetical protein